MSDLEKFLDDEGRVDKWPAKRLVKIEVLKYISDKFKEDYMYDEKEVNEIIKQWHTFGDYFLIRRGMVDYKLLTRTRDGAKYWKTKNSKIIEE